MKKQTIGIIILAAIIAIVLAAIQDGRDWGYERKHPTFKITDGYVDSIFYDSLANTISIWKGDSLVVLTDVICYWPEVNWNWFKEGYRPGSAIKFYDTPQAYVISVNGEQGEYIPTFRDTINDLTR